MKATKNLGIGFALCLGLIACGQSGSKEAVQPAQDSSLVGLNTPVDQLSALKGASESDKASLESNAAKIREDIKKVQSEAAATQDPSKLDQLNEQLKELRAQYAATQDALSDAEGYALLLKFVIEHQITSLDQLPQKFKDAKVELQKKLDEVKSQEDSFLTKVEAAITRLTDAQTVLRASERMLKEKAAVLKLKPNRTPEEQGQLDAITSYLASAKDLMTEKEALAKAQSLITQSEEEIVKAQKLKTDLTVQKTALIRQLIEVPSSDVEQREAILKRIQTIQDQMVDADLAIYDRQEQVETSKAVVVESEKNVQALKATIDSLIPGLSSISNTDLAAEMKKADDAYMEFQTLQTDYQKWLQLVRDSEMALSDVTRLEAFFALKFPDTKPAPQPQPQS